MANVAMEGQGNLLQMSCPFPQMSNAEEPVTMLRGNATSMIAGHVSSVSCESSKDTTMPCTIHWFWRRIECNCGGA